MQVGAPTLPAWLFGGGGQVAIGMNLRVAPGTESRAVHRWGEYRYYHVDGMTLGPRESFGELAQIGGFRDGVRVGEWRFFHADGSRLAVGSFVEGKMHGPWQVWRADGGVSEHAGEYVAGVQQP